MSNTLDNFLQSNAGKKLQSALGISVPTELRRFTSPALRHFSGTILLGGDDRAELLGEIRSQLPSAGVTVIEHSAANDDQRYDALIFDGTGLSDGDALQQAYQFFHGAIRRLTPCGRIVIFSRPHLTETTAESAAAQRALEGLTRSLAKEVGSRGSTAQLVRVSKGAEKALASTVDFLLSPRSAYVNAQVISIEPNDQSKTENDPARPLANKVALVTGASRGIGAAIAATLARDGATVLGVDVPAMADELQQHMQSIGGRDLLADICAADAPKTISDTLAEMGGADIVVHNAGVTRDKTLANMSEQWWQMTLAVNLSAAQRITQALLENSTLNDKGSIVGVSSMNGIAGQRGQTNYAASKAGVIGYVDFMSRDASLRERGITVNAVAPGFIETAMTAAIPFITRTVGRRLNSLSQGGLPEDVAETIAFFSQPASRGVNGNIVRVCGQSWLGA